LLRGEAHEEVARLMVRSEMTVVIFVIVFIVLFGWWFQAGCPAQLELYYQELDLRLNCNTPPLGQTLGIFRVTFSLVTGHFYQGGNPGNDVLI
jgi:hypothetical protein